MWNRTCSLMMMMRIWNRTGCWRMMRTWRPGSRIRPQDIQMMSSQPDNSFRSNPCIFCTHDNMLIVPLRLGKINPVYKISLVVVVNVKNCDRNFEKKINLKSLERYIIWIISSFKEDLGFLWSFSYRTATLLFPFCMQTIIECPKIYRNYVLHLLKYTRNLYLCRCSIDLR